MPCHKWFPFKGPPAFATKKSVRQIARKKFAKSSALPAIEGQVTPKENKSSAHFPSSRYIAALIYDTSE